MSTPKDVQQSVYALTKRYSVGDVHRALREIHQLNRTRYELGYINEFLVACDKAKIEIPQFVKTKQRSLERRFNALEHELNE